MVTAIAGQKGAGMIGMVITGLIIAALFVYVRNNWSRQQG